MGHRWKAVPSMIGKTFIVRMIVDDDRHPFISEDFMLWFLQQGNIGFNVSVEEVIESGRVYADLEEPF